MAVIAVVLVIAFIFWAVRELRKENPNRNQNNKPKNNNENDTERLS